LQGQEDPGKQRQYEPFGGILFIIIESFVFSYDTICHIQRIAQKEGSNIVQGLNARLSRLLQNSRGPFWKIPSLFDFRCSHHGENECHANDNNNKTKRDLPLPKEKDKSTLI
jgi:hypothetical protein